MSQTILTLDSQALNAYGTCEVFYNLSFLQHYKPKSHKPALVRGTHLHNVLYLFYKSKMKKCNYDICVSKGMRYLSIIGKHWPKEEFLLLVQKFSEYCTYYRGETLCPIGLEKGFSKILWQNKDYIFIYEGRIDFVGRFKNDPARFWMDHKSESSKEELNPNSDQFIGYSWALGSLVGNGIINYLGMQKSYKPEDSFRRTSIQHKKEIIQEWKDQTIIKYFKIMDLQRHGIYLKNRHSCKPYRCNLCMYNEICNQTHPAKIQSLLNTDFEIKEWKAWR